MGSSEDDREVFDNEKPRHQVQFTCGFWLFDMPCTQALWQVVMGTNPSRFQGANRPVEKVSWEDCQEFITQLNEKFLGLSLRLPTEAQWEYACRAGTETPRYAENLDAIAWYNKNSKGQTQPVKQKQPNTWGLYDMLGNVLEWCHDGLRMYSSTASITDPLGPIDAGAGRAIRGGYWDSVAQVVRAAFRFEDHRVFRYGNLSFRCASS